MRSSKACPRCSEVTDAALYALPFFENRHREFASALVSWCASIDQAPDADAYTSVSRYVRDLGSAGFLAPVVVDEVRPRLDVRTLCVARETLAYHAGLADFAFAMQGLGSGAMSLYGSNVQRAKYLPAVARGDKIAAFALSEAEAGSDVAALQTRAVKDGDDYILDGRKTWISNTEIADFYTVFARTSDAGARGITAFVVDAASPGLVPESRIETIAPHPLGSLTFVNCRVPSANRIGEEGEGFKIAMSTLDIFRATVGAAALGFARRAFDESRRHVVARSMFDTTLGSMQLTQAKIAAMATDIDAGALLVYRAAWAKDSGADRVTKEAAMAKWFATEAAGRITDGAVQLFGGRGVTKGETVEALYREVRALRIYEGASEVQQLVIARSVLGKP